MIVEPADLARTREGGHPIASRLLTVTEDVPAHTHEFCELAVVIAGHCCYRTRRGALDVGPGAVMVVRPGEWHAYDVARPVEVFNVYVGTELLTREFAWVREHPALVDLWWRGGELPEPLAPDTLQRVVGWLHQISHRRRARESIGAVQLRSLLDCVLCEFVPDEPARSDPSGHRRAGVGRGLSAPVMGVLAMIEDDPARPWTVDDLARGVAVSASHLHRLFRQDLASSPVEWLSRTRAEQMAARLGGSDDPVGVIGAAVGWGDPNYAARRFRAVFGLSPTQYREQYARR